MIKIAFELLLGALPQLLALLNRIGAYVDAAEQRGIGRQLAIGQALAVQSEELDKARVARFEAHDKHVKDPTDGAFDDEFKRPEP